MNSGPILSIVTPTRGNFTGYWLEHLLRIKGDVEFVLVYPPGVLISPIDDERVKVVVSPVKGEVSQRLTGLLNAQGAYVMSLDDDDYAHPDILEAAVSYFKRFPDSWVIRFSIGDATAKSDVPDVGEWDRLPGVGQSDVIPAAGGSGKKEGLLECLITPLEAKFNPAWLVNPFKKREYSGEAKMENFNNRVWRSSIVKDAAPDFIKKFNICGPLKMVPLWGADWQLSLFIQAKNYKKNILIGHWLFGPQLIKRQMLKQREFNPMVGLPSVVVMVRGFPRVGYFWNIFFEQFWGAMKVFVRKMFRK